MYQKCSVSISRLFAAEKLTVMRRSQMHILGQILLKKSGTIVAACLDYL